MSRLYACIISKDQKKDIDGLITVARQFSYGIEKLDDGLLFDVSGLERLIGTPDEIAQNILEQLKRNNLSGSIAVAETVDTATLLARQNKGHINTVIPTDAFPQLPLTELEIDKDTLNVFSDLGLRKVSDLLDIPREQLADRYGLEFKKVIEVIEQKGASMITRNVKETSVSWDYQLDFAVDDFGQMIFIINHGLDFLTERIHNYGLSTEQLNITFKLSNRAQKSYEIKTSFPTLDKTFWLKLINLRVSLDPPEAAILSIDVTALFTKPRPAQRGLYAVSRPEPESLLLTINKIKKLVGENYVGVPTILNQRAKEPFTLDSDAIPLGSEHDVADRTSATIAFSYFHPPIRAEVLVRESRLIFIKSTFVSGRVQEYSGVWKANSKWWDRSWKTQEWDVEIENKGIYRLCKVDKEWFLAGEYD
jgi:protein ImuB